MTQPLLDPVACLKALVACRSVTPAEGGALHLLADILGTAGFRTERLVFSEPGTPDVENLFATIGSRPPHLVFAGHTDVVPPGDAERWSHPPFAGEVADGSLYGRGAVDMKGGIAAFLAAASEFLSARSGPVGTLSLLITGDEEGPAINGTVKLLGWALGGGHRFDAALVGEPTSVARLGDTVKVGRRGSLSGTIRVPGRQGHAAYPHLAENPVPRLVRMLHRLTALRLDEATADFQPSNLEVTSVDVGNPAFNVIPGEATARFNVRFNDRWSIPALTEFLRAELDAAAGGDAYELTVAPAPSEWFLTRSEALIAPLSGAIEEVTGLAPELSTGGGTSDARFFKAVCPAVEFGLVGDTMHQANERVPVDDLRTLTRIYRRFLDHYFAAEPHA
jgi:succinyl-diaminopimelate desuccinylase